MGIDIQVVPSLDFENQRPRSWAMYEWLDARMEDFKIRYGRITLTQADVDELASSFGDDPVAYMLLRRIETLKLKYPGTLPAMAPYEIELFVST